MKRKRKQSPAQIDLIVDSIKDEIDELSGVIDLYDRRRAATELIEYLRNTFGGET